MKILSLHEAAIEAMAAYGLDGKHARPTLTPLGIAPYDRLTGGLSPGQSVGIASVTGVGKSSIVLNCCLSISGTGGKPGYLSLEDPSDFVGARALSAFSGINSLAMRRGDVSEKGRKRLETALGELSRTNIRLGVHMGPDVEQAVTAFSALAEAGCNIIFVDYLQKVRSGRLERRDEIGITLSKIQEKAQEHGIPVVFISQVRRLENPAKWPTIHDLKESGDLENEFRTIILLRRTQTEDGQTIVEGRLAKSSVGGEGLEWAYVRDASGTLQPVETAGGE